MKTVKQLILILLFTFSNVNSLVQAKDSLSVSPQLINSSGIIHFEIAQSDTITLLLFNYSGDTLMTFFKSTVLPSGSYNINITPNGLEDGIYFVALYIGSKKTLVDKVIIINSAITGLINQTMSKNGLVLYPNPTNNYLDIPVEGHKTIVVANLNGEILKSFTTDQQVISLFDLAIGQYSITVLNDKKKILTTQKILKSE